MTSSRWKLIRASGRRATSPWCPGRAYISRMIIKNPRDRPLQHFSSRKDVDIMQIPHKNGPSSASAPPSSPPSSCILLQRAPGREGEGRLLKTKSPRIPDSAATTAQPKCARVLLIITLFQFAQHGVEFGSYAAITAAGDHTHAQANTPTHKLEHALTR